MAKKQSMYWLAKDKRWKKKHKESRATPYTVNCGKLEKLYPHLFKSATKEGSRLAANQWWEDKLLEIERHPQLEVIRKGIEDRELVLLWCELEHDERREQVAAEIAGLKKCLKNKMPLEMKTGVTGKGGFAHLYLDGFPVDPLNNNEPFAFSKVEWMDAIAEASKHRQRTEKKVSEPLSDLLEEYIADRDVSQDRQKAIRRHVGEYIQRLGSESPDAISGISLVRHKSWLLKNNAQNTAKTKLVGVVAFVKFLHKLEIIDAPRIIDDLKISKEITEIETWTDEQLASLWEHIEGELRMYCLLASNCGFLASDIAALRHDEIDWQKGQVKSKRHKTNKGGDLWFPLWKETFELMKRYRSKHEELAFTTTKLTRLWEENGKNLISKYYGEWKSESGLDLSTMVALRATARNHLEDHETYGYFGPVFLQHANEGVDKVHYRKGINQKIFSKMVSWLGKQFGFAA